MLAKIIFVSLILLGQDDGGVRLGLTITPTQCYEPCTMTAHVSIDGLNDGAEVCIELDSEGYATKSCWPHHRRLLDVGIKSIPAGQYDVSINAGGKKVTRTLYVYGAGTTGAWRFGP